MLNPCLLSTMRMTTQITAKGINRDLAHHRLRLDFGDLGKNMHCALLDSLSLASGAITLVLRLCFI